MKRSKRSKRPIPWFKILTFNKQKLNNIENPQGFKNNGNEQTLDNTEEIKTCGNYKVAVDSFCYAEHKVISKYFLSHFHADHYMGLTKNLSNCIYSKGLIYCTGITKKLIIAKFNITEPERIISVPFYKKFEIYPNLIFTFLPANHCPGSAIIVFEYYHGSNLAQVYRVLHTGDFRANKKLLQYLMEKFNSFEKVYLDTTYLNPNFFFPDQELVVKECGDFVDKVVNCNLFSNEIQQKKITDFTLVSYPLLKPESQVKKNYLVVIGSYTIGKERLAIEICKRIGSKLYVNPYKRKILKTFIDDCEFKGNVDNFKLELSTDPFNCQVHLIPMQILNYHELMKYYKSYESTFEKLIAFHPTGWNFGNKFKQIDPTSSLKEILNKTITQKVSFGIEHFRKQFNSNRVIQLYKIPYSEHSSFRELTFFSILLNIRKIIPTVNLHNDQTIREMDQWIKEWKIIHKSFIYSIDDF
ncbi:DNA cross-link repair protein PSO2 [Ascoidea rubescens DSM 1968]|uniref:DRMBL-domain-containing protein n=1 Tax=Ascoidea rubescens DSM 1968 TaxID=1344418 RepID=A0A1D2VKS1_9ASCO|nr:DRMBL-domain-containing protein [Ascoidea rubescens DSM 1968]ODV62137.1 DRMBL-domain-containing protein [Ascoidea rubescens DSM 1968]